MSIAPGEGSNRWLVLASAMVSFFAAAPTFGPEWAGGGAAGLLATSLII